MTAIKSGIMIFLVILFAYPAFAQDAKLTAAGRKEGKVIIYGSMEQDIFEGVRQSFDKKTSRVKGSTRH